MQVRKKIHGNFKACSETTVFLVEDIAVQVPSYLSLSFPVSME
jgi:hypothetical protein